MIVFGLAGLLVLVCFLTPLASALKIPFTLALSAAGALLGYMVHVHGWAPTWVGDYLDTLQAFEVPSDTILVVFLPVLLFEAAMAMNVRRLINDIAPIMLLAVVAVFICTLFVGWGVSLISTQNLATCLLMGAIVATTDPAAVVGIFKEVGAPKRLTTIVEGESLLNDAAAIALYSVLLVIVSRDGLIHWNLGHLLTNFLTLLLGGAAAGYVIGRIACSAFSLLRGWPTAEISLSVATAYIAYIVPEHYLGVSGVVSTVVAGLVISTVGRTRMTSSTFYAMSESWHQLGFWASSLIFLFAAMMIPRLLADVTWDNVFVVLTMMLAALLARIVTVFGLMPAVTAAVGTKVSKAYKIVICWGGLRGALSLALALSVTEHQLLSDEISEFVAIGATGFVLGTLLVNGLTLRPLIKLLGLDKLSEGEQALRDQAVVVATAILQQETEKMAVDEQISRQARQKISQVFEQSIQEVQRDQTTQLADTDRLKLGLTILARREFEMLFNSLRDQGIDSGTADHLLGFAEAMEDGAKEKGQQGYMSAMERSLHYPWHFRLVLRLHYSIGMPRWLGRKLSQRFVMLIVMRWVTRRLIGFSDAQLTSLVGETVAQELQDVLRKRLARVEQSLHALRLQYPKYAEWLEQTYLGRAARGLERARYRQMLDNSLISGEVYDALVQELEKRWAFLDTNPLLDVELSPTGLMQQVPVLRDLPADRISPLAKRLKPRLALPNERVLRSGPHQQSMFFVASGAVSVLLPDSTHVELGSGEFFGELQLLGHDTGQFEVRSLGYTKLLELSARDFKAALEHDAQLRQTIETVASQRFKALQTWRAQQQAIQDSQNENASQKDGAETGKKLAASPVPEDINVGKSHPAGAEESVKDAPDDPNRQVR
ncbi:cation:proton antiporter [Orrella marina]|nr:cation:proton antiporter [Orrella marina]